MKRIRYPAALAVVICLLFGSAAIAEIPSAPRNANTYVFDMTGRSLMNSSDIRRIDECAKELDKPNGMMSDISECPGCGRNIRSGR